MLIADGEAAWWGNRISTGKSHDPRAPGEIAHHRGEAVECASKTCAGCLPRTQKMKTEGQGDLLTKADDFDSGWGRIQTNAAKPKTAAPSRRRSDESI
jgi:hypothetical protein